MVSFLILKHFYYSGLQDGSELPTRLSVAAADCFLALTEALTRKTLLSKVPSRNNASNSVVALSRIAENKVEPVTTSSESSNNVELDWLLWDHLDELIVLVQKLVAVCLHSQNHYFTLHLFCLPSY